MFPNPPSIYSLSAMLPPTATSASSFSFPPASSSPPSSSPSISLLSDPHSASLYFSPPSGALAPMSTFPLSDLSAWSSPSSNKDVLALFPAQNAVNHAPTAPGCNYPVKCAISHSMLVSRQDEPVLTSGPTRTDPSTRGSGAQKCRRKRSSLKTASLHADISNKKAEVKMKSCAHSPKKIPFPCGLCKKMLSRKDAVTRHQKKACKGRARGSPDTSQLSPVGLFDTQPLEDSPVLCDRDLAQIQRPNEMGRSSPLIDGLFVKPTLLDSITPPLDFLRSIPTAYPTHGAVIPIAVGPEPIGRLPSNAAHTVPPSSSIHSPGAVLFQNIHGSPNQSIPSTRYTRQIATPASYGYIGDVQGYCLPRWRGDHYSYC